MIFNKAMTFEDEQAIGAAVAAPGARTRISHDLDLLERLKTRDSAAFELLVERYSDDIYALTYRLTNDREEAADLTQETFLRAFRHVGSFRGDANLRTWLFRIAINESRNRFRWWMRRRRNVTSSIDAVIGDTDITIADTLADNGSSPEENAVRSERESALMTALAQLKPIFREAIVLADIEGLSYEECALAAGVNVGTIKSRISRGRDELRRRLKDF